MALAISTGHGRRHADQPSGNGHHANFARAAIRYSEHSPRKGATKIQAVCRDLWEGIYARCAACDARRVILIGLVFALVLEAVSIAFRFGLGLQSSQATSFLADWTLGLRIHHGYLGLLLFLVTWAVLYTNRGHSNLGWIAGIALSVSDLVHHFLVLWVITGSPQFDIFYPV